MIMTNKILAVALIAALVGGSLGAVVMHSRDSSRAAEIPATSDTQTPAGYTDGKNVGLTNASYQPVPAEFKTAEEQTAYKVGFADGFQSCADRRNVSTSGVAYRNAPYASTRSSTGSTARLILSFPFSIAKASRPSTRSRASLPNCS